jgi:hypothetical protein
MGKLGIYRILARGFSVNFFQMENHIRASLAAASLRAAPKPGSLDSI